MSIVTLYIATTLDGFIARPDGNIDWLTSIPASDTGDYGYTELLESIEACIMGRRTYEDVLGFGIEWPYANLNSYIVTCNANYEVKTPNTFIVNGDFKSFIAELKSKSEKDIWLVGGGQIVSIFLENDLIDTMIISIVPINLGDGIRLFPSTSKEVKWKLAGVQSFNTGLVNLTYERDRT